MPLAVVKGETSGMSSSNRMSVSRDLFTTRVNSTMMSINERFTYLQKKARPNQPSVLTIRAKNSAQQQASAKNRRLAMQMERRLSAMAAMRIMKKNIRQRLGVANNNSPNVRDRLTLPRGRDARRGRGGGRVSRARGRSLRRSQSVQSLQGGNLQRSASMQSLNQGQPRRGRSRSRSRNRTRTPSRNSRANSVGRGPQRSSSVGRQRRFSTGSVNAPGNGPRRGKQTSIVMRNRRLNNQNRFGRNQRGGGNSGRRGRGNLQRVGGRQAVRGGRRGRGRSQSTIQDRMRGKGNQTKVILPTKEELDKQLEQYMANTKSHLDKEIDTYMKESGANDF